MASLISLRINPYPIVLVLRDVLFPFEDTMTLEPLMKASSTIQFHVASVMVAIVLTPIQLILKRGSEAHRWVGRGWMIAMALTALSSFFISTIPSFGPFSLLHVLSVLNLAGLAYAYRAARQGEVGAHSWAVISLVISALIVPGIFTLFPGRIMYKVVFGG